MTSKPGQALVALYYRVSPSLAELISRHEPLCKGTRLLLTPLVFTIEHATGISPAATQPQPSAAPSAP